MNEHQATAPTDEFLVLGYGNTLRGDDGVGPAVSETVASLKLPRVRTLACQQLSPEHAELVSQMRFVIFVDASVEGADEVRLRPIQPANTSQLLAHAAEPGTLLALARDVYGHVPEAWWLTIPVKQLGFADQLSEAAQEEIQEATEKIRELITAQRRG